MRTQTSTHPHDRPRRTPRPADRPSRDDGVAPPVSLLAVQFLAWIAAAPRTRADVMDAWRSTCPRQSVWEDSVIDGLVAFDAGIVILTARGRDILAAASG